jgi:polyisoprenyl-teichoic acid--peptidoglycan teichoic acid transferase
MAKPFLRRLTLLPYKKIGICIVLCVSIFCFLFYVAKVVTVLDRFGVTPSNILQIIFSDGVFLDNTDGRTNILLLGTGGDGHEGGDLTDSMILVSVDNKKHVMTLLSIPRDIWSDTLKDKVNSAYHYGEIKNAGGGLPLAKVIVEEITGIPVQYGILFDFSVFSDAVDFVGGIDIHVTSAFTDSMYPIAGKEMDECNGDYTYACRYKTITFPSGLTHMNGNRALEYVRSRHAQNEEGSDFARARRQQEVIFAIKKSILQPTRWLSMIHQLRILQNIDKKIKTDITVPQFLTLSKDISSIRSDFFYKIDIQNLLIDSSDVIYGGKYVLIPKNGFDSLHEYIRNVILNGIQ